MSISSKVPGPGRNRLLLTGFFLGIVIVTIVLTCGILPQIQDLRVHAGETIPQWKVMEIPAGDRLVLVRDGRTNVVSIAGIAAPPAVEGPALTESATFLNLDEHETMARGIVARKALYGWVNRRLARLEVLSEDSADPTIAYVYVQGMDVGTKVIEHGQAYTTDLDHPRRDSYRRLQTEARKKKIGIWRD